MGTLTVTNCTFASNTSTFGGAIDNFAGNLTVIGSTFTGNSARHGGAIRFDGSGSVTGSTFSGNSATDTTFGGGAIVASTSSP